MSEASEPTTHKTEKSPELDVEGWKEVWQQGRTGFHKSETNPLLEQYQEKLLCGGTDLKVLVPLCGKTLDIKWLSDLGHTVVGVEGAEQAILEFFSEQKLEYTKEPLSELDGDVYKSQNGKIRIYNCDFFQFEKCKEGDFDAVWDRGSLVAINIPDRQKYAKVIKAVCTSTCRILLITIEYPLQEFTGPPHVVPDNQVTAIYEDQFKMEILLKLDALEDRWRSRGLTEIYQKAILLSHK